MDRIIVTGANGFIGSVMVWELNRAGTNHIDCVDFVTPSVRPVPLSLAKYSNFVLADNLWTHLEDPKVKEEVTWVIHMGACSSTTETDADYLWRVNTDYTRRLYEWCTKNNKHLIYASSAATYGQGELGFSDETSSELLQPLNFYGQSKLKFDQWLQKQPEASIHCYGLKFFNVYGPNEDHKANMSSLVYKSFFQVRETGEMGLFKSYNSNYKDGCQLRDFVYVKDVTGWMLELMQKTPKNGIYNMGFGKARAWLDLANGVFAALHKRPTINWLEMPANIRNQYQYFTEAKMDKWFAQGLSQPKWSLEDGIADYVTNYLSQGKPI